MNSFHFLIFALLLGGCSTPIRRESATLPPPRPVDQNIVVLRHRYFEIHYDPKYRLAKYVKYTMTAAQLKSNVAKRRDRFVPDPLLKKLNLQAVGKKDYAKSRYDKGHLAPSADFAWSQQANDDTFVMSNMVPQSPNLNRSAWKLLEEKVRRFACGEGQVTVVTGPILEKNLKTLKTGVPIPNEFFKVVIDDTPPRKVIAFLYRQTDKGDVSDKREVPVQEIESKIKEDLIAPQNADELRQPAQINPWKERDCADEEAHP